MKHRLRLKYSGRKFHHLRIWNYFFPNSPQMTFSFLTSRRHSIIEHTKHRRLRRKGLRKNFSFGKIQQKELFLARVVFASTKGSPLPLR